MLRRDLEDRKKDTNCQKCKIHVASCNESQQRCEANFEEIITKNFTNLLKTQATDSRSGNLWWVQDTCECYTYGAGFFCVPSVFLSFVPDKLPSFLLDPFRAYFSLLWSDV